MLCLNNANSQLTSLGGYMSILPMHSTRVSRGLATHPEGLNPYRPEKSALNFRQSVIYGTKLHMLQRAGI